MSLGQCTTSVDRSGTSTRASTLRRLPAASHVRAVRDGHEAHGRQDDDAAERLLHDARSPCPRQRDSRNCEHADRSPARVNSKSRRQQRGSAQRQRGNQKDDLGAFGCEDRSKKRENTDEPRRQQAVQSATNSHTNAGPIGEGKRTLAHVRITRGRRGSRPARGPWQRQQPGSGGDT